jgi:ferredoxin
MRALFAHTAKRTVQCTREIQRVLRPSTAVCCRSIHVTAARSHGGGSFAPGTPQITLTFVDPKKEESEQTKVVKAYVGDNLLRVAHKNDIDLEGACEGVCACSTCHVILDQELLDSLPEATEDEEDMLDMAFGLTDTSRLGCQVIITPDMEEQVIYLPKATRNFYVDGHVPKPH